jgi:hypothetical protein
MARDRPRTDSDGFGGRNRCEGVRMDIRRSDGARAFESQVQQMRQEYAEVSDYFPIAELEEAKKLFSEAKTPESRPSAHVEPEARSGRIT